MTDTRYAELKRLPEVRRTELERGKVLPAGTYVFQLADSPASRHVVQVFDQEGRILATMLTIPTARPAASDETRIMFDEQPAGAPFPIKKWFYPGELSGEEFLYPTHSN